MPHPLPRKHAMTLPEVMVAATVLTLVLAALLGGQILAIKSQRRAAETITLYAFTNSICDQVCGLGYDEVDCWVKKSKLPAPQGNDIIAINDPGTGKLVKVPLTQGQATEMKPRIIGGEARDLSLKIDYSVHDGAISGMDKLFGTKPGGPRYSTIRDLKVRVDANPLPGLSAYTVSARVEFTDAFNHHATLTVSRLVSNLSGYANVN